MDMSTASSQRGSSLTCAECRLGCAKPWGRSRPQRAERGRRRCPERGRRGAKAAQGGGSLDGPSQRRRSNRFSDRRAIAAKGRGCWSSRRRSAKEAAADRGGRRPKASKGRRGGWSGAEGRS
jgi:hypothetical protein